MSNSRIGAIIPVKTFSRAKTRLGMSPEKTEQICQLMLESVLKTISNSDVISKTILVSKDETALNIGKKFGAVEIYDESEQGVNSAVLLADNYFTDEGFEGTIVFPQDIPLITPDDIRSLYEMKTSDRCVLVVPSRKFDGTNALFRMPPKAMETHYDEDSYKIHLDTAEKRNTSSALVLIRRIMLDIDDQSDLRFILSLSENDVTTNLKKILDC
ncbi:2-phospho-L-lactate guanylyltransferase [Nitrosotalea sinensis]|uniref:2-phospho-L-lactate guanylyltransferase n=1 Tax=Nitrosotalea sinensis TaxID=1499975 RepID=A0A2H1EJA3_9ARCH|nr:2-phospho-L-lactate guanylyltransferase [Candidatus Nitrosotalea sinensis]SHO47586.1 2-phospho-L-lactate guanylyltransferase [Candidatus Nitrosotalea sinensis]